MAKTKKKKLKSESEDKKVKLLVPPKYYSLLISLVMGITILYVISTLYFTGGHFFLPVDDSFLYFHYAQQLSQGAPFQYNSGESPTSGARSLLYTLILTPGFFILSRDGIIYYSFLLGILFLFLSSWLIFKLGKLLFNQQLGIMGSILFLLNGPISWGYLSGTEIGLFSTIILATLYYTLQEKDSGYKKAIIFGSLLPVAHPEGIILSMLLVLVFILNSLLIKGGVSKLKNVFLFIPVIAGIGCMFLNLILTGSIFSTFLLSNSSLFSPNTSLLEILARSIKFYAYLLKEILGGFNGTYTEMIDANAGQTATYFAPFAFLFFLLGILPLAVKEIDTKEFGVNILITSWFFVGLGLCALTFPTDYSWNMYLIPYYPLFLIGVVMGIYYVSQAITNLVSTVSLKETFYGIASFFIIFSILSLSFFVVAYGKNCKDNYHQKMGLVKWVKENLPPNITIAMTGINILRYYENRNFIDLMGLGTKGLSGAYQNGVGSIFEWLEEKKLYPDCFILNRLNWTPSGLLKTQLYSARVVGVRNIEPINVYQTDWSLAHSGDEPVTPFDNYKLIDKIDVANLDSEAEHNYKFWEAEPGLTALTYVYKLPCGARYVTDGCRIISGGERMVIKTEPNQELKIVMRTIGVLKLNVMINGKYSKAWIDEQDAGDKWVESSLTIPAKWINSNQTKIQIEVRHKQQDTYSPAYYWFFQK